MRAAGGSNAVWIAGVLCAVTAAQGKVAGLVRDAARAPVEGAAVAFHHIATAGVPGLRSDAEIVETLGARTDARGRFAIAVPEGAAGTLAVDVGALGTSPRAGVVAGDLLAVELVRRRFARVRLLGLEAQQVEVVYEGEATVPARAHPVAADGTLELEVLAGLQPVLLAPAGFVGARDGRPWAALEGEREIAFERVPVRPGSGGWTALDVLRGVRAHATWGRAEGGFVWFGQDQAQQPWFDDGLGGACVSGAPLRLVGAPESATAAVLVHAVTFARRGTVHFASAAHVAGADLTWGTVPAQEPFLIVVRDAAGWILGPGGNVRPEQLAWPGGGAVLMGSVTDEGRRPLEGARVLVRPAAAVPQRPGSRLGGCETATSNSGRFRLPVRLADGDYEVLAVARDGRWVRRTVAARAGAAAPIAVVLPAGERIEGTLLDAHGEPVAGALVQAWSGSEPLALASFGLPLQRAFTAADGRFSIGGLRGGVLHEVWCETRAHGRVLVNGVRPGGEPLVLSLAIEPPQPR